MVSKILPWSQMRLEYETTAITKKELSVKYNCTQQAISNNSKDWVKYSEKINKAERDIIETYKSRNADKIIKIEETKQNDCRRLDSFFRSIVFKEGEFKGKDIPLQHQIKAGELLGKRAGYFAEDNKQRNPYSGLSQEEINKKLRAKMKELGFGR